MTRDIGRMAWQCHWGGRDLYTLPSVHGKPAMPSPHGVGKVTADAPSGSLAYTVWGAISGYFHEGKRHRCVSGAKSGPKFYTPSLHPDCLSHGSR